MDSFTLLTNLLAPACHRMHGVEGRGSGCPDAMTVRIQPCTNLDPDHRRCFRHPEDDEEVIEVVDESLDEVRLRLDTWVVSSE